MTTLLNYNEEIWKDIMGYEGLYEVSSFGRVKTKERLVKNGNGYRKVQEKILLPTRDKTTGYYKVGLSNSKRKNFNVHSLVAKAFFKKYTQETIDYGMRVNHIDGDKLNNHISNLEIITEKENVQHAFKIELIKTSHKVEYENVVYKSKSEARKILNFSEKKLNKLIENGTAKVIK